MGQLWFALVLEPRTDRLVNYETHTRSNIINIFVITTNIALVIMDKAPRLRRNLIKLPMGVESNISLAKNIAVCDAEAASLSFSRPGGRGWLMGVQPGLIPPDSSHKKRAPWKRPAAN